MAASVNDKLLKAASRWTGTIGSGGVASATTTTIPLSSVSGLPTDTAIILAIDRVDSDSNSTPSSFEVIKGVVSGSNIDCDSDSNRGIEGTAQSHSAGAVVEYLFTASQWDEMIEALLEEHNQDGTHADVTLDSSTDFTTEHNTDGTHKSATVTTLKATGAEIDTGTEDAKIVTPKAIADSKVLRSNEVWDWWQELTALTRVSDTTATLSGNWTDRLQKGDKLWWLSNGSSRWNYIIGVSYSAPNTTITITTGFVSAANDMRFESGHTITEPKFSKAENPQGFPGSFTWTPVYSCSGSMTFTDVTTGTKKFSMSGNKVFWDLDVQGTTGETASNIIYATAPVQTPQECSMHATVRDSASGYTVPGKCFITSDKLSFTKSDASNWSLGATRRIAGSGFYYI